MNESIESNVWRETTLAIFFFLMTDTDSINETLITSFVSQLRKCVYFRESTYLTRETSYAAAFSKRRLVNDFDLSVYGLCSTRETPVCEDVYQNRLP